MVHSLFVCVIFVVAATITWFVVDFGLKVLRRRAAELEAQSLLIDRFYDLSKQVMRKTSEKDHPRIRELVQWLPIAIQRGRIAHQFVRAQIDSKSSNEGNGSSAIHSEFGSLDEEQSNLLARMLGVAILASTYDLPISGRALRGWINSLINGDQAQVPYPEQTVRQIQPIMRQNADRCLAPA